eukprot:23190_1
MAKDSFGLETPVKLPVLTSAGPCSVCTDSADVDADVAVPEVELRPNHYALEDSATGVFTTPEEKNKAKGKGKPTVSFSLKDTKGCSCEHIIDVFGLGFGHRKFGCSIGVMKCYTEWVNSDSYDPTVLPDCVGDFQDDELTEEAEDTEVGNLFGRYLRGGHSL